MNGYATTFIGIFLTLSFSGLSNEQKCKDDTGASVDWLIAYKIPVMKKDPCSRLRDGTGYIYITSDNHKTWRLSDKSLNDSTSFAGRTLSPLYNPETASKLMYLMYNDQPPTCHATMTYAHAKGVVITDGVNGMWLVHSSPTFPIEPVSYKLVDTCNGKRVQKILNHFSYPKSASKYGQSYLCVSLPHTELNKIGMALQVMRPKIYASNVPENLEKKFYQLTEAIGGRYSKMDHLKVELTTHSGKKFVSYAKSKYFNRDLYRDWLAKDLHSPLEVESWKNGPNPLHTNHREKLFVLDVAEVDLKASGHDFDFRNSQDHSKWAVTFNCTNKVVCIGDINRMLSQFKRGGGTICLKDESVWKLFSLSVVEVKSESKSKPGKCRCRHLFKNNKFD